jgi:hypothetical protein
LDGPAGGNIQLRLYFADRESALNYLIDIYQGPENPEFYIDGDPD